MNDRWIIEKIKKNRRNENEEQRGRKTTDKLRKTAKEEDEETKNPKG